MRRSRGLAVLLVVTALGGCVSFVPIRERPPLYADDPVRGLTTRQEAIARLGSPAEVRASDLGEVLVYRRVVTVDANASRFYANEAAIRYERYERVLLYLDGDGKIVRSAIELE